MSEVPNNLREIHSVGTDTRERIVDPNMCPLLNTHGIGLVGISEAKHGFEFLRQDPQMAQILLCYKGTGTVLVRGEWQECHEGVAYLTPFGAPHAYHAVENSAWEVCWVMFPRMKGVAPIITAEEPLLTRVDPTPLYCAILGLYHETISRNDDAPVQHWVELIFDWSRRITRPWRSMDQLWKLWEAVDSQPSFSWTLPELARRAGMSIEKLRTLSLEHTGRSPMQQVAYLRMRRAAVQLQTSQEKVEAIAGSIGYANAFAFSTTFKRFMGMTPSEYRLQKNAPAPPS